MTWPEPIYGQSYTCAPLNLTGREELSPSLLFYASEISTLFSTIANVTLIWDQKTPKDLEEEDWVYLGKSSSCHSSFTSMFSIRRVASVVPIPLRGPRTWGWMEADAITTTEETYCPKRELKGHSRNAKTRVGCFGRSQHGYNILGLFYYLTYILGLWSIIDHMDFYPPA